MDLDALLQDRLRLLRERDLFRDPAQPLRWQAKRAAELAGLPVLDASGNDYLGLSQQTVSRETVGGRASRLLGGGGAVHLRLERELAKWLAVEDTLLFSSGYAANVGVISALVGHGAAVFSDSLNHASIIDGCRLCAGHCVVYPHRDLDVLSDLLRTAPVPSFVVTESYFSMDGTSPDLAALCRLCRERGAYLIVDEAHALGAFGSGGRGLCQVSGATPDVLVGTFGKAFGAHGAFVAGSATLRTYLWNRARSFAFSTATSPALAASLLGLLERVDAADAARARLIQRCAQLESRVSRLHLSTPPGRHGPIFPIVLGSAQVALRAASHCASLGIIAPAIRSPTVPERQARLRLTLAATMSPNDVVRLGDALASLPREDR